MLEFEGFRGIIVEIVVLIASILVARGYFQSTAQKKALEIVRAAVLIAYESYVRLTKKNSPDGKLTTEQRATALGIAMRQVDKISESTKVNAKKILGGKEMVELAIRNAVRELKNGK